MPIQTPQWTDFLICPICGNEYDQIHNPVSLGCGHTLCQCCLSKLQRKQCPYDQTTITINLTDLPTNYALLQLIPTECINLEEKSKQLQNIRLLVDNYQQYCKAVEHVEKVALFLKPFNSGITANHAISSVNVLSRPMQRKLVMLINCQLLEEEGRVRAIKATRSLGERTVTELIIQHQNPQQLSTHLWAGVRARGCQFLGPAMQEEVLKLVLLALEDGSALSRKVLVMFVVQRLEPHFPQASKTSIGHVVQLLYRASCFVVSKRESDSSLMKLKEEFRTYDALRREHDAQIVEIATEAGLRIAPDQWSSLLYGDTVHKSHMQSIIDKLQNPQSFSQSVQELVIALQRTGDPGNLCNLRPHLEFLADIDVNQNLNDQIWGTLCQALEAVEVVINGLVNFIKTHGCRKNNTDASINIGIHASKYKISLCRDFTVNGICPRGINCTFAHTEDELNKFRSKHKKYQRKDCDNIFQKCTNSTILSPARSNMQILDKFTNDKLSELGEGSLMPLTSEVIGTPTTSLNGYELLSPQCLTTTNRGKQQNILSKLQQALSDVKIKSLGNKCYDQVGSFSALINQQGSSLSNFNVNDHVSSSGENYRLNSDLTNSCAGFDNFSSSSVNWSSADAPNVSYNNNSFLLEDGWHLDHLKTSRSCTTDSDSKIFSNQHEIMHEIQLLNQTEKVQNQHLGFKKHITDIHDEDGIVSGLKDLEMRLNSELAEEEQKLWPLNTD